MESETFRSETSEKQGNDVDSFEVLLVEGEREKKKDTCI